MARLFPRALSGAPSAISAARDTASSGKRSSGTVSLMSPIAIALGALMLRPVRNSSLVRA